MTTTKRQNKTSKALVARAMNRVKTGLDEQARAWSALLADPCHGPLTHPIYPGSDGGALIRVENEYTLGDGAAETAMGVLWLPGHPGTDSIRSKGAAASTTNAAFADGSVNSPGYTFLRANATNARCVAACAQVYWPGSELNRQGFLSGGCIGGGTFTDASAVGITIDNLRTMCDTRTRMPDGCMEIRWAPSVGDTAWVDPSEGTSVGSNINQRTCIALAATGLPVATGVRIRLIAVYEYTPKYNLGVAVPYNSRAISRSSFDDVINYLDRTMPNWRSRITNGAAAAAYAVFSRVRGNQARIEL